jgi:magnesium transporter
MVRDMPRLNVIEQFEEMLEKGLYAEFREKFLSMDPADAADVLEHTDPETQKRFLSVITSEQASDIISEMDDTDAEEVIDLFDSGKIAEILSEMAPDDRADIFRDIDEDKHREILSKLPEDDRLELKNLIGYEEDSAGDLMTPELCAVKADATVQEAIMAIANQEYDDPISMIFAVDNNMKLLGGINISVLLSKPRNSKIGDVVENVTVFASTDEDQESIANNFVKYDLYVMPVVDENGILVGRITADDVMEVLEEEAVEDIAHMAGAPDMETNEDSPVKVAALRLPWLFVTMLAGIVISMIIQRMIGLTHIEGLAAFVPVIMAMGGNTGMQASAITVRGIALGEIEFGQLFKISLKEVSVGILMGCVCGTLAGTLVWMNLNFFSIGMTVDPLKLSVIVGVSMCSAMTFAALTGTLMPIILHKMNIDPALASGPFVTTGNDLSASMIYFLMCFLLLKL